MSNDLSPEKRALSVRLADAATVATRVAIFGDLQGAMAECAADAEVLERRVVELEAKESNLGQQSRRWRDLYHSAEAELTSLRAVVPPSNDRAELFEAIRKLRHFAACVGDNPAVWGRKEANEVLRMTDKYECDGIQPLHEPDTSHRCNGCNVDKFHCDWSKKRGSHKCCPDCSHGRSLGETGDAQ